VATALGAFVRVLSLSWIVLAAPAFAQSPPDTPTITEPVQDGAVVNAADVHMETGPFHDPDPGDWHLATDWEIWTLTPPQRVWAALGATGPSLVHVHLGDGQFEGPYFGREDLIPETNYRLRVRHEDDTGLWSDYAIRFFVTGPPGEIFPMLIEDVTDPPPPIWADDTGDPLILPAGAPPGFLRMDSPIGELFLALTGVDGLSNAMDNPLPVYGHRAVRVRLGAGSAVLNAPVSTLAFTDGTGRDLAVYLPAVNLAPMDTVWLWIASDGSSFWGTRVQTAPDFSSLARAAPVPWRVFAPGYRVGVVAGGFQLPVNIAFVPHPGGSPASPYFYVTELYGTIKVVTRDLSVHDYATGLLNFDPGGIFPGTGEQGLAGIAVDPNTGDLYVGMLYDAAPPNGPHYPKVVHFTSADGGLTAATQTTILSMPGEDQGPSHFISNFTIGPDSKLYVHMGDGFHPETALNLSSFRGKVLRLNLNGSAPSDNPFYNPVGGITATDYIFAYGFRNPFGGAWRIADGSHYEVENGPSRNDRLARVDRGQSYGWNGSDTTLTIRAIYNWDPPHAPVNIAFVQPGTFGGSGYPAGRQDHAFVTESGSTYATGPQTNGKRIVEFVIGLDGSLVSGPTGFIQYTGSGKATACGLAAGPDGLYMTDLYKDQGYTGPTDPGANVLRISYVGVVDFTSNTQGGPAPLAVSFTDLSDVPGASAWHWTFGDGGASDLRNPSHSYTENGYYNVRLRVTGTQGTVQKQKNSFIRVGSEAPGLLGEYFRDMDLSVPALVRTDPEIYFDWGGGSPDTTIGPDGFSIRWSGVVRPEYSEFYTFYTTTDDGVRLWIGPLLLVDDWTSGGAREHSATVSFIAGQEYDIRMEYFENQGTAQARLEWSSRSQPRQVVPSSRLLPASPALVASDGGDADAREPQLFDPGVMLVPSKIGFRLPQSGRALLTLHDVTGREVARLFDGGASARRIYTVELDPGTLASGVYFLRLAPREGATSPTITRKVVIVTSRR
jgi:glucose/arabinose dehydrogenase